MAQLCPEIARVKVPKYESNEDFIVRIMNYGCPTGPLIQAMVIEALNSYSKHYAVTPIPDNGLIDSEAWMETAQWLKAELDKKYAQR